MATKFCIFCGGPPSKKSKEHVIPAWLIRLTGIPKRRANFGPIWDEPGKSRDFAFDAFHFPACTNCNNDFAKLEADTMSVIVNLLADGSIDGQQACRLLDWLDKVRVGLWLAMNVLDRNMANIRPKFHIKSRVRMHDRAVAIYRCPDNLPALNFIGVVGPTFQRSPTCFALKIKHLLLLNASTSMLCAGGLGFPYFEAMYMEDPHGKVHGELMPGRERITFPISPLFRSLPNAVTLFQACFSEWIDDPGARTLYDTPHVRNYMADMPHGSSRVFVNDGTIPVIALGPTDRVQPVPSVSLSEYETLQSILTVTMDTQLKLFEDIYRVDNMSESDKEDRREQLDAMRMSNNSIIEASERAFRKLGYF